MSDLVSSLPARLRATFLWDSRVELTEGRLGNKLLRVETVDGSAYLKIGTGEVGRVRVSKIENKGKRNRRVNIVFDDSQGGG